MKLKLLSFILLLNVAWAKEESPIENPFKEHNLMAGVCTAVINGTLKDPASWKIYKDEATEEKCHNLEQQECPFFAEKYPEEFFSYNCQAQVSFHWIKTAGGFSAKNNKAWPSYDNQVGIEKCQASENAELAKLCDPSKVLEGMLAKKSAENVLVESIMENDRFIFERLLKKKVSLNKKNKRGLLPVQAAVAQCRYEMLVQLIEKKVNLNVKNEFQRNLIGDAIFCANTKILQELITNKVEVNTVDKFGETPLMMAAEAGNLEVMEILLKSGADLKFQNKKGATAYTRAKRSNNPNALKMLQKFAKNP